MLNFAENFQKFRICLKFSSTSILVKIKKKIDLGHCFWKITISFKILANPDFV